MHITIGSHHLQQTPRTQRLAAWTKESYFEDGAANMMRYPIIIPVRHALRKLCQEGIHTKRTRKGREPKPQHHCRNARAKAHSLTLTHSDFCRRGVRSRCICFASNLPTVAILPDTLNVSSLRRHRRRCSSHCSLHRVKRSLAVAHPRAHTHELQMLSIEEERAMSSRLKMHM